MSTQKNLRNNQENSKNILHLQIKMAKRQSDNLENSINSPFGYTPDANSRRITSSKGYVLV